MDMDPVWVPIHGWMAGHHPVLGAFVGVDGGKVQVLDADYGEVRPIGDQEKMSPVPFNPSEPQGNPRTVYALASRSSGAIGRGRYEDIASLVLAMRSSPQSMPIAFEGEEESRVLTQEERQTINQLSSHP
jgi:hypothetical protein